MIDKASIETLKQKIDIVDTIGGYLELKRAGANFKALCPFHNDNSPSLHVSPAKQIYHCFSCGAGGDAITFIMEYEKLNYAEAIEKLAVLNNFVLTYTKDTNENRVDKKILEQVNLFYTQNLDNNPNVLEYLAKRGIGQSSMEKFEIGYAPASHATLNFLKQKFFTAKEAIELGIIGVNESGNQYARFIERVTFPIYSPNGKIAGFGGRTLTNHPSKYVNSPQSKVFNKSRLLYGYNLARESIMRSKKIIVCEGYLDVIMLHQAGFHEAVATLGTALTNEHLPLLTRGEPKVILSYDGDNAGIDAAFKAAKLLSAHNIDGGVVLFSGNMDPADMVQHGLIDKLNSLYSNPTKFVEFCLEQIINHHDIKNAREKQKALEEAVAYLKTLPKVISYSYVGMLSQKLNIKTNLIILENKKPSLKNESKFEDTLELSIIKTLLTNPQLIDTTFDTISVSMFKTHGEELQSVFENRLSDPKLMRLLVTEDIKTYDENELLRALSLLLSSFYEDKLKEIKEKNDISFEQKSFFLRRIRDIISRLKKGELVPYESFSTF